jgi:two-component system phosphate regulon sensor histidine kinase PhoR
MPRTRLAWRLFAGWCSLVAVVLAGCTWLASVQLARQADAAERRRLTDAAVTVAAGIAPAGGPLDVTAFAERARTLRPNADVSLELVSADGDIVASTVDAPATPVAARPPGGAVRGAVAKARTGRTAAASSLDPATGQRRLSVAVPHGPPGSPTCIVLATADTTAADAELASAQRRLIAGCLVVGAIAAAAGWGVARRAARPVEELGGAARRLAAGDVTAAFPASDVAEVAELAGALGGLREQLVERGLLIGRQGTQQEAVLGSMIEGVLAIDARQRIVGINRAAADLLGLEVEQVVGRTLQQAIRNPDLRRFALEAIDCRDPVEDDIVLHGVTDRTIHLRGTALRDVSGEGGAVIVLDDVTDVHRLEKVRRDFVANVSHELKTPVASIKGFVETLLDGAAEDPGDRVRFLEIIGRQADRLAAIIEDLLALSRIEQSEQAGSLPVEPQPLAGILAAAADDCRPRAADRSVRLEIDCPPDLAATVNGPLVEQAVINLVDNAIKYSESGKTVWLSAATADDAAVLRVRDEGCGIAAEHLPRLFERFYRVDMARSRALGGTGLGLAIVKHIVQAHGGTVGVESEPGEGTTFTLRIPVARG